MVIFSRVHKSDASNITATTISTKVQHDPTDLQGYWHKFIHINSFQYFTLNFHIVLYHVDNTADSITRLGCQFFSASLSI